MMMMRMVRKKMEVARGCVLATRATLTIKIGSSYPADSRRLLTERARR